MIFSTQVVLTKYRKEVREAWDCRAQVGFWTFLLVKVLLDAFISSVNRQREDILSQLVHTNSLSEDILGESTVAKPVAKIKTSKGICSSKHQSLLYSACRISKICYKTHLFWSRCRYLKL